MPPFSVACPRTCTNPCEEQVIEWIQAANTAFGNDVFGAIAPTLGALEAAIGAAPTCMQLTYTQQTTPPAGNPPGIGDSVVYTIFAFTPLLGGDERTIISYNPLIGGLWSTEAQVWASETCDGAAVIPDLPGTTWTAQPEGYIAPQLNCETNCNCAQNSQFSAREQEAVVTFAMQTRLELDFWYNATLLGSFNENYRIFPKSPQYFTQNLTAASPVNFNSLLPNIGTQQGDTNWLNVINAGNYSYYTQAQGTTTNGWEYREFYAIPTFINDRAFTFVVWRNVNNIGMSSEWGRTVFLSANNTPYVPSSDDIEGLLTPPELLAIQDYDVLNGTNPMNVMGNSYGALDVFCTCECDVTTALYQFRQAAVYAKDNGVAVINAAIAELTNSGGGAYYDAITGVNMVFAPCFNITTVTGQGGLPETTYRLIANSVNDPAETYSTATGGYSYLGLWGGIDRPQNTTIALQCGDVADVEKTFTQILGNNSPTQDANYGTEAGFDAYATIVDLLFTTYLTAGYTTAAATVVNGQGDTEYKRYAYAAGGYTYVHRWVKDSVGNYLVPPTVTRTYDTPNAVPSDLTWDFFGWDGLMGGIASYVFPPNETTNLAGVFTLNKL